MMKILAAAILVLAVLPAPLALADSVVPTWPICTEIDLTPPPPQVSAAPCPSALPVHVTI